MRRKTVDEYVKSHSFYDSYLIISSNTLSKDNVAKSNEKEQKLYYITPAALEYEIDVSDDSLAIFNCFSDECLSFFFIVDDKPVYIASDLDDLSYKRVSQTGIKQKICTQNTSGGIWCFMLSGDKCSVLSKDVENDGYWRGFLLTKLAHGIRFDPPTLK